MKILLILALLFMAGTAQAQSCLPSALEQRKDFYRVSFGGLQTTVNYHRLTETGNNARARELQEILQWKSDVIGILALAVLVQDNDEDGLTDPNEEGLSPNYYHSDARGQPAPPGRATHITSRCAIAGVTWDAVKGDFVITWTAP